MRELAYSTAIFTACSSFPIEVEKGSFADPLNMILSDFRLLPIPFGAGAHDFREGMWSGAGPASADAGRFLPAAVWGLPAFGQHFRNFAVDDENHYQYNREWDPNMESGVKGGGVSFFPMR
ncbi:MAG: hypothetical protein LOD87_03370 [Planifilum fulgidum]